MTLKPSERIEEIAYEIGLRRSELTGTESRLLAIIQFLDEQAEKEGKV